MPIQEGKAASLYTGALRRHRRRPTTLRAIRYRAVPRGWAFWSNLGGMAILAALAWALSMDRRAKRPARTRCGSGDGCGYCCCEGYCCRLDTWNDRTLYSRPVAQVLSNTQSLLSTVSDLFPCTDRARTRTGRLGFSSSLSDLTPWGGPDRLRARFDRFSRIFPR